MAAPVQLPPSTPPTTPAEPGKPALPNGAPRQDIFLYTVGNMMLLLGMVFLITLVVVMTGLSIAGYAVGWGWLGILLAFLLMVVGFLVSWYYRSILAKPEVKKVAPGAPPAYGYGGSYAPQYPSQYASYPSYSPPSYSYPSYPQQPQYGYGYQQQGYGSYGAYGYQAPRYVPPVSQPAPPGPSGAPKTCSNCQRAIPFEARFCPYCRAVQGGETAQPAAPAPSPPPSTPPT